MPANDSISGMIGPRSRWALAYAASQFHDAKVCLNGWRLNDA
ncbi:MAG: hypothetical protein ACLTKL_03360 [Streptococcus salivarius]